MILKMFKSLRLDDQIFCLKKGSIHSLKVKRLEGMARKLEHPVDGVCIHLG